MKPTLNISLVLRSGLGCQEITKFHALCNHFAGVIFWILGIEFKTRYTRYGFQKFLYQMNHGATFKQKVAFILNLSLAKRAKLFFFGYFWVFVNPCFNSQTMIREPKLGHHGQYISISQRYFSMPTSLFTFTYVFNLFVSSFISSKAVLWKWSYIMYI